MSILAGCGIQDPSSKPQAVQGQLELGDYQLEQDGPLELNGEWSFYWKQLLTPDQLNGSEPASPETLISLPGSWNGLETGEGPASGTGFGTYHLRVHLQDQAPQLGIKLPYIRTAYRLWVDGKEVAFSGKVGDSPDTAQSQYTLHRIEVNPTGPWLDLVIQVSNFDHRLGGIWNPIILGTSDQINTMNRNKVGLELLVIGSLLAIWLHHVGLFVLRRKEKGSLYFGMFCFFIGVHAAFTGEGAIYCFFPKFNWLTATRIEYTCLYLAVPTVLLFVYTLFPLEVNRKFIRWVQLIAALFTLSTLVVPAPWFTYGPLGFDVLTLAGCVYLVVGLGRALLRGREGALYAVAGFGAYVTTVSLDVLYYNQLAPVGDLSFYGLLGCVFMTGFILSSKQTKASMAVETLSRQLRELNIGLEAKIRERTAELERINSSLEKMNEDLARMETSRRHLLSNISHDLGTPMTLIQGYVEALIDGVVSQSEQQHKYLKLIHTRITGLNRLIADLFQLSKLEARQLQFDIHPMSVEEFARHFNERYELEVTGAGLRFATETHVLQSKENLQGIVHMDVNRIDQVLTNIIYNAVKHTPEGGLIQLQIIVDRHSLVVQVQDSGSGIDPEDLPYIFDRFYKKDKSRNTSGGGSGLGLAIAKEIIDYHGGRIWAQSRMGQGACLAFMLPLELPTADRLRPGSSA
ncbi:sensor histidine kinase [Paenibacillus cremeus]|nr:ATP-binding protein [Paenibacillus cremeus]